MRSYQDLRWCIRIADVREQEQRQESTAPTLHVDPPLAIHVVAAVNVPTRVSWILHARKSNRKCSTDSFPRNPTAWPEERVVRFPERWRRARGCESGTLRAREADNGLGPGRGIARINSSRMQFVLDDVHACTHSVWRYCAPQHKK